MKILRGCFYFDLNAMFSWFRTICIFLVFSILSIHTYLNLSHLDIQYNIIDLIFFTFSGPSLENFSFMDNLKWFIPQILFLSFIGKYIELELNERAIYTIIRSKSIFVWCVSKFFCFFTFSLYFFLVGFISCFLIGIVLGVKLDFSIGTFTLEYMEKSINQIPTITSIMLSMFFSLVEFSVFTAIFMFLISNIITDFNYVYVLTCLLTSISFFSYLLPMYIRKLIPGDYSIMSRYNILSNQDTYLDWPLSYLFILIIVLFSLLTLALKRKQF